MRGVCLWLLLALAACSGTAGLDSGTDSGAVLGWQTAVGKPPTRAEFAAVYAACQDRVKGSGGPVEGCLADLGLHRTQ